MVLYALLIPRHSLDMCEWLAGLEDGFGDLINICIRPAGRPSSRARCQHSFGGRKAGRKEEKGKQAKWPGQKIQHTS